MRAVLSHVAQILSPAPWNSTLRPDWLRRYGLVAAAVVVQIGVTGFLLFGSAKLEKAASGLRRPELASTLVPLAGFG